MNCEACLRDFEPSDMAAVVRCHCQLEMYCTVCNVKCKEVNMRQHVRWSAKHTRLAGAAGRAAENAERILQPLLGQPERVGVVARQRAEEVEAADDLPIAAGAVANDRVGGGPGGALDLPVEAGNVVPVVAAAAANLPLEAGNLAGRDAELEAQVRRYRAENELLRLEVEREELQVRRAQAALRREEVEREGERVRRRRILLGEGCSMSIIEPKAEVIEIPDDPPTPEVPALLADLQAVVVERVGPLVPDDLSDDAVEHPVEAIEHPRIEHLSSSSSEDEGVVDPYVPPQPNVVIPRTIRYMDVPPERGRGRGSKALVKFMEHIRREK
jgi:hypothetical protein